MAFSLKDSVASITAGITTIGFVVGAFLMIDERYAHAQEVKRAQLDQAKQIQQLRIDNTKKFYRGKIDDLEQKKFEITVKPVQTPTDKAYLQRYDTQITALKEEAATEIKTIIEQ